MSCVSISVSIAEKDLTTTYSYTRTPFLLGHTDTQITAIDKGAALL